MTPQEYYAKGFCTKCAEYGIDPVKVAAFGGSWFSGLKNKDIGSILGFMGPNVYSQSVKPEAGPNAITDMAGHILKPDELAQAFITKRPLMRKGKFLTQNEFNDVVNKALVYASEAKKSKNTLIASLPNQSGTLDEKAKNFDTVVTKATKRTKKN